MLTQLAKFKRRRSWAWTLPLNTFTLSVLAVLLQVADNTDSHSHRNPPPSFDFIVVGGGTAGCVIASRLSENGKYTVALLESGGYPIPESYVPAFATKLIGDPAMTKLYSTVSQLNAGLLTNGTMLYASGYVLGGTSSINGMYFNRGSPRDFDNWANATGDESWSYSNMLRYFKKVEDYAGDFPSDKHGYGGPISITRPRYAPGYEVWRDTAKALGYPYSDQSGPQRIGFTPVEVTKRFGRRVSSFTGYIKPHLESRPNLHVYTNALVTRIIFQGTKAVGVRYTMNTTGDAREYIIEARKEVILSAGVIESPVLLMKSGIGPKEVLEGANVKPVKFLPVGENLQDHVLIPLFLVINNRSDVFVPERDLTPENMKIYSETGEGPYSSFNGGSGQAFIASRVAIQSGEGDWADLQLQQEHTDAVFEHLTFRRRIQTEKDEAVIVPLLILTRPKSKGRISLNTRNIDEPPLIDPQYLSHEDDMAVAIEGIKFLLKLHEEGEPYQKMGARYPPNLLSACEHVEFRSDKYWSCYIRQISQGGWHGGGTCRMGRSSDHAAVVDNMLKVVGCDRLRVVDTSIMPSITNANTMAPAYGIAEKAADIILSYWEEA